MGLDGRCGFGYGCQGRRMGEYGVEVLNWVIVNYGNNQLVVILEI